MVFQKINLWFHLLPLPDVRWFSKALFSLITLRKNFQKKLTVRKGGGGKKKMIFWEIWPAFLYVFQPKKNAENK